MPEIAVTIVSGEDIDVIIAQDDNDIAVNITDGEQIGVDIATEGPQGPQGPAGLGELNYLAVAGEVLSGNKVVRSI